MTKQITVGSVLEGRIATYAMLARLFREEIDEAYLAKLKQMRCPVNTGNADVDVGYKLMHSYLSHVWERSLEDLSRDYLRVFIGSNTTGHAAAYPNESVHTSPDRLVMQDARDEVRAIYRAAGLESSDLWKSGEDHIACELEYMQVMSKRASDASKKGDTSAAASTLMAQYRFLEDHLLAWTPFLVDEMLKFAQTDLYRALAHLTRGFLEEDRAFLAEVLAEELEVAAELEGAAGEGETQDAEAGAAQADADVQDASAQADGRVA